MIAKKKKVIYILRRFLFLKKRKKAQRTILQGAQLSECKDLQKDIKKAT